MGRRLARLELPGRTNWGILRRNHGEDAPMHVGLATGFAHQRGDAYPDARFMREELENLVLAEELGFDSVWITEHHFSDYSMSNDPLQLLSYLAGRTRRIKLGTQVIIVPWRDPVRLAEAIVNLDHVSEGRAILGFGGVGDADPRSTRCVCCYSEECRSDAEGSMNRLHQATPGDRIRKLHSRLSSRPPAG